MTPCWFSLSHYSLRKVIVPHFPCDGLYELRRSWSGHRLDPYETSFSALSAPQGLFSRSVLGVSHLCVWFISRWFLDYSNNLSCVIIKDGSAWGCGKDICLLHASEFCQIRCGIFYRLETNSNSSLYAVRKGKNMFSPCNKYFSDFYEPRRGHLTVFTIQLIYFYATTTWAKYQQWCEDESFLLIMLTYLLTVTGRLKTLPV